MPETIMVEPRIFCHVIPSPNNSSDSKSTKIKLVPLNMYAVESGTRARICCHKKAYTPMTPIAPSIQRMYVADKKTWDAAIFMHI